jgi:hypothetical protein
MPIKATHKPRIGSIAGEVIDTGTGCRRDTPQQRALPAGKGQRMILQPKSLRRGAVNAASAGARPPVNGAKHPRAAGDGRRYLPRAFHADLRARYP